MRKQLRVLDDLRSHYSFDQVQTIDAAIAVAKAAQDAMFAEIFGPENTGRRRKMIRPATQTNQKNDISSVCSVVFHSSDARTGVLLLGWKRPRRHKEDYLTADEVEQLREAQEPHLRLKVLGELLENRLDKARAIKDPASVKAKPPEPKPDKKKNAKSDKPDAAATTAKKPEPAESKSFLSWMEEYLQCLEELSDNVENFSSTPLEPKAYLKSLNKLESTLQEHTEWIDQIESQLDRPEKKVVAEISDVLEELTEDLKAANEKTQEQIKLMKEAEKARSSRRR